MPVGIETLSVAEALTDCFAGRIDRDCVNCAAHPMQGGPCCFGDPDKYSAQDPECAHCRHRADCRAEIQFTPRAVDYRRPSGLVQLRRPDRSPISSAPPQSTAVSAQPPRQEANDGETPMGRLAKDAAWGGLTGVFQVVTRFFERGRPRMPVRPPEKKAP